MHHWKSNGSKELSNLKVQQKFSSYSLKIISEIVIGDQVAGIAGLKTQLQVPSTSSTTDIDEMKTIDGEPSPASPLNGENADQKVGPQNQILVLVF
jgi:hypothetical protein